VLSFNRSLQLIRRLFALGAAVGLIAATSTFTSGQVSADLGAGGVVWGPSTDVSTIGQGVDRNSLVYDISQDGQTIVAMWARRFATGSFDYTMQLAIGTIGAGTQIVWGPVIDLGTQAGNYIPGAVAVSADGRKVALGYTVATVQSNPTPQDNSLFVGVADVDPVSNGSRGITNLQTRSESLTSSPNPAAATALKIQISDDGTKAVSSYVFSDNSNNSLRSHFFGSSWSSPVTLASLGNLGSEQELQLSANGGTVAVVFENMTLSGASLGWFAMTGSFVNGSLAWSQSPVQIAGPNPNKNALGVTFAMSSDGTRGFTAAQLASNSGVYSKNILVSTAVISGASSTWTTPVEVAGTYNHPTFTNISMYPESVDLSMADDGSTVALTWDDYGDDGTTYVSQVKMRIGGFVGNSFSWSGSALSISTAAEEDYSPKVSASTDGSKLFLTYETSSGFSSRTFAVAGGNANWSGPISVPTRPYPVFRFSPVGDRVVMMFVNGANVGSILGTPTYPVAPPTTSPATTAPEITSPATTGPVTTVAAGSLPATGNQPSSLILNALLVTLLGATLISTKRRLRTR
jgi:hypothetical protein